MIGTRSPRTKASPGAGRHGPRTAAALLAICVGLVGCDGDPFSGDELASEPFSFETDASNLTSFRLIAINGNIEVQGIPGGDVVTVAGERRVRSSSREDAEEQLERLRVQVTALGDEIVVTTEQPDDTGGRNFEVRYEITIPRRLLTRIESVNGNIDVQELTADLVIANVNGNIGTLDIRGNADIALTNGNVDADRMTPPPGGRIVITDTNGNIDLGVPTTVSAELTARVTNGNIITEGLELRDATSTNTSLTATLGDGDGTITVVTVNGNVAIRGFPPPP